MATTRTAAARIRDAADAAGWTVTTRTAGQLEGAIVAIRGQRTITCTLTAAGQVKQVFTSGPAITGTGKLAAVLAYLNS